MKQKWKNVWDNKPPRNKVVLLWLDGTYVIDVAITKTGGIRYGNTVYWMPLPKPPTKL